MTGSREAGPDPLGGQPGLASVVLIDRKDDVAAVCGRLDAAPTYAIVVHAPDGNRQLSTQLGIRRLQRHAEDTGRVIAVATGSRSLAARARQAGIPVARRPEHVRWDASGKRVVRLPGHTLALPAVGRYLQFALLAVAFLFVIGLTLLAGPKATVRLTPPVVERTARIVVEGSPGREDADIPGARLRLRDVMATVQVTLAAPATGTASVPVTSATALVTMSNTGAAEVLIAKGEILVAQPGGLRFQIDQETAVPGGKSVVQQASSLVPGEVGNVPAGALGRWEDPGLATVMVSNAAPASGGTSAPRPAVSKADVDALLSLAASMETSPAVREPVRVANPGFGVLMRTATVTVIPAEPQPAVGLPATIVLLPVTFQVTAVAVDDGDLAALALDRLGADAPGPLIPGSVRATETGARQSGDASDGALASEFELVAEFADGVTVGSVRSSIRGRLQADARSHLEQRYGIENVKLDMRPAVAPLVPLFGFRIAVEFVPEDAGAPPKTQDAERTPAAATTASPTARP